MMDPAPVINQLFEMQARLREMGLASSFERNFNRLFALFEDAGYVIQDPTGEPYQENRTDCEVSISGALSPQLVITKTIKPAIYQRSNGNITLIQKAIAIAEKK